MSAARDRDGCWRAATWRRRRRSDRVRRRSTVRRAVNAAIDRRLRGIAEDGGVNDIGIRRMDAQPADGARLGEAEMLPGFTGVGGFIDAVALHDVAAELTFTHADVDDV